MAGHATAVSADVFLGELRQQLGRTRSYWRRIQVTQGLCLAATVALGSAFALLLLDHWLALPMWIRAVCAVLWGAGALFALFWLVIRPIRARLSDERVALHIESRFPEFENRLISAVQLSDRGWAESPALMGELVRDAASACNQINVLHSVDLKRMWYYVIAVGFVALDLLVYSFCFPDQVKAAANRYIKPTAAIAAPHSTQIAVQPGDIELPPGADLEITAAVSGTSAKAATVLYRFAQGKQHTAKMQAGATSDVFAWKLPNVVEDVWYRVQAGDHTTQDYKASIVSRPTIGNVKFSLKYPAWTRFANKSFESKSGDLSEPIGTEIAMTITATQPLKSAKATFTWASNSDRVDARDLVVHGATATLNFKLSDDGEYSIELYDERDTRNEPVATYGLRAIPDELPMVLIIQPGEDRRITPTETLGALIKTEDDFGVTKIALKYFPEGNESAVKPLAEWNIADAAKNASREHLLSPQELGFKAGQTIVYFAEATDTGSGANRSAQSPHYKLQVVSQEEMQKGEQQSEALARTGLLQLIEMQQQNKAATHDLLLAVSQKELPPTPENVLKTLRDTQTKIRAEAIALSQNLDATALPNSSETLNSLAAGEMVQAVKLLEELRAETLAESAPALTRAVDVEKVILVRLEALLRDVGDASAEKTLALFKDLQEIIEMQIKVRDETSVHPTADDPASTKLTWAQLGEQEGEVYFNLGEYQIAVEQQAREMEKSNANMAKGLAAVAARIGTSKVLGKCKQVQRELTPTDGKGTIPKQEEIIRDLQALAFELKNAAAAAGMATQAEVKKALQDAKERLEKLQALQGAIKDKTLDVQGQKQADHFTEAQTQQLDQLAEAQQKVADVVADIANELAMVPDHDFTDHLNSKSHEIFEDVEMAKDALKKKSTEIAVARDDAILEAIKNTKERVEDLEKWLPDSPDRVSWNEESFSNDELPKIPNVELPDELDDIVGDLLQSEAEMDEEAEDKNANWATADAVMGWDAMDGPIANFSAKGVTGNDLPNANEMGGRSGSGRSGRSSGEMVEDIAKALEGRNNIPDRRTDDPVQKGQVKEEDPNSKSFGTGGGKQGGYGAEGLQGKADPVTQEQWKRIANKQAQARQNAQQLFSAASSMGLPTGEMDAAIELMRAIEQDILNRDYEALKRDQASLQQKLGQTLKIVSGQTTLSADMSQRLPTDLQKEVLDARDTQIQPEYQPLIDDYFRALSEAVVK